MTHLHTISWTGRGSQGYVLWSERLLECCLDQSQRPSIQRGELVGSEEEGDFCHMQELDPGWH